MPSNKVIKKYSKYKDSGIPWIGAIPQDWKISKIKNYCEEVFSGGTPSTTELSYWDGNISWLPSGELQDCLITKPIRFITEEGLANSSTKMIPANTTLMAMTGATCAKVGYLMFNSCANQSVTAYIGKKSTCSKFLFYLLLGAREDVLLNKTGGAQGGINVFNCKNIVVPFISSTEQQAIADYLDEKCGAIDKTIETEEKVIEKLKEYKQSIITEAVTKGLDKSAPMKDSGIPWIGQIPRHWEIARLNSLFSFAKGLGITKEDLTENGIPVISYGQIHSKTNTGTHISDDLIRHVPEIYLKSDTDSLVNKGDFIFADTSEDVEGAGNCVFIDKKKTLFAGYHSIILKNIHSEFSLGRYLSYLFSTIPWRTQIQSKVTGIKVYSISKKILKDVTVIIPGQDERLSIAEYLDEKCSKIDKAVVDKKQVIEKLTEYKKSLIYECVTGKRRVA